MHGNSRMANASNLHHHQQQQQQHMNGMRSAGDTGTVLVHHHTAGGDVSGGVHHQAGVDSKAGILQHGGVGGSVTDIDGNFIHDILGMNSQIEIIDEDPQHHGVSLQQQQQQHQEVIVHQQQADAQQSGQQQIHIQNATPEQLLELQQQGAYTQENGNRVIVVSELFKCDICNLAFIFKDHYIHHCDDHIRMVAEHINLKGIVPINNFEEANEILDFRSEDDSQQQQQQQQQQLTQTIGPDGNIVVNGAVDHGIQEQQQIIVHGHQQHQQGGNTGGHVIQQHHQQQVIQQDLLDNNGHSVVHIGPDGSVLDSSMIEDIDEGDPQLSGAPRSGGGGSKPTKRTSQQQLQAQLNSEWCKCLPCDFKFRTPLSLSRHLNAHMENRNRCEKCNKYFTSYVSLNTHSRQCRGDEEALNQSSTSSSGDLGEAAERGRSVSVDGPVGSPGGSSHANKVYHCKKCNVQFSSATQYRDHKLTHSNDVYTCNECHKAFLSIINLNRHRQNDHQHRQTFMCAICNCEFTNVEFLEEHNKTRSHLHNLTNSTGGGGGGGGGGAVGVVTMGRARTSGGGNGRGADVVVID